MEGMEQLIGSLVNYGALGAVTFYLMTRMERTLKENTESNNKLAELIRTVLSRGIQ